MMLDLKGALVEHRPITISALKCRNANVRPPTVQGVDTEYGVLSTDREKNFLLVSKKVISADTSVQKSN